LNPARAEQLNSKKFAGFVEVGKGVSILVFPDFCCPPSTNLKVCGQELARLFVSRNDYAEFSFHVLFPPEAFGKHRDNPNAIFEHFINNIDSFCRFLEFPYTLFQVALGVQ